MTPRTFISKWSASKLKESSASQEHFIDLCRLLDLPTPVEADPEGESYCFEKGAKKDIGGDGFADVWKRGCFAWEYKGKHANLDNALDYVRRYIPGLDNPPLLIVSDMETIRIHTCWTNTVSEKHEIGLRDLEDVKCRNKLKWAMTEPERLKPGLTRQAVTEQAASGFAGIAHSLREKGNDSHDVAQFINRLIFCMFAEDVQLLPEDLFTRMLEQSTRRPDLFPSFSSNLFGAMSKKGGIVGFDQIHWFNGGLFNDDSTLVLDEKEIEVTYKASKLDWSVIEPSILGTLFERGLDPEKRAQLGAHYTDSETIMRIIEPVIIRPLLSEWEERKKEIEKLLRRSHHKKADSILDDFRKKLEDFTILDPACGSGNFLYLALRALKNIEHKVNFDAQVMRLLPKHPVVGPQNVKGIEINPYAAELARLTIWIGEIQWMIENGYGSHKDPVLKPLEAIECRDAIMTPDGGEPEWPDADVVIGNPPFLGGKLLISGLGENYVSRMFAMWNERVPREADLVCYWFVKAGEQIATGKAIRAGLVATNSIRGGANRRALQNATDGRPIFNAWSNEPWVIDGASVRVSLVCFSDADDAHRPEARLDGVTVDDIHSDLTATRGGTGIDLTRAVPLPQNIKIAYMGDTKSGSFDISGDTARRWLAMPSNPNKGTNADVLKPWVNGMDLTRRPAGKWIIDFGWNMTEADAALYEAPFGHVRKYVRPMRQLNRRESYRDNWWRHVEPRPGMWQALDGLRRYIATARVAKHRLFVWLEASVCPDSALIVFARDDDVTFGILHSRFHRAWSLRLGTSLEDRPRYTPTTSFETFPFPMGLTPDMPVTEYDNDMSSDIAKAARQLDERRNHWLNPPELVEWVSEPVRGYPKRPVAINEDAKEKLKNRTLTNLYNEYPQWLSDAHKAIDDAVAGAYGWAVDISEEDALAELLQLNLHMSE